MCSELGRRQCVPDSRTHVYNVHDRCFLFANYSFKGRRQKNIWGWGLNFGGFSIDVGRFVYAYVWVRSPFVCFVHFKNNNSLDQVMVRSPCRRTFRERPRVSDCMKSDRPIIEQPLFCWSRQHISVRFDLALHSFPVFVYQNQHWMPLQTDRFSL